MTLTIGFIGNGKSTNRYHMPFILTRKDKIKVKTIYNRSIHFDTGVRSRKTLRSRKAICI